MMAYQCVEGRCLNSDWSVEEVSSLQLPWMKYGVLVRGVLGLPSRTWGCQNEETSCLKGLGVSYPVDLRDLGMCRLEGLKDLGMCRLEGGDRWVVPQRDDVLGFQR